MPSFGEIWTGSHDVYVKIAAVLDWAERYNEKKPEHQQFDTTFVESLRDWPIDHTQGQLDALDNIIERWHIKLPLEAWER